jgi:hypothetical protein
VPAAPLAKPELSITRESGQAQALPVCPSGVADDALGLHHARAAVGLRVSSVGRDVSVNHLKPDVEVELGVLARRL